ncbi:MAG: putative LPS assembly protein LptD [Leadbetterella sp.]
MGLIVLFFCSNTFAQGGRLGGIGGKLGGMGNSRTGSGANRPTATVQDNGNNSSASRKPLKKPRTVRDSTSTIVPDSLRSSANTIETTVESFSSDSTVLDMGQQEYHLYGNASVVYGNIELRGDYIRLNWAKSEVFAHGSPDTTKANLNRIKGRPVFVDGGEEYNMDTIRYNFKSKKAIISNIVTQQGEGFVTGRKVKKDPEDNMYLVGAKYTTCNMAEPHFHIRAKKIKLVNKKSLVSGPFNLMLDDIPLPIGLPWGFFPIPKKKEIGTSGFVMGNYGEEPNGRGYYFRDFGYYHAFNERVGVKLLAQIYSNGSSGAALQSTYSKRYRYSGNLNLQYNRNRSGEFLDTTAVNDFSISWSHAPQRKRPDRSFSANVNAVSNGFNRNNRRLDEIDQYTNNSFNSGVQYSRSFGKLIRTSSGVRVDQNVSTKVMNASWDYNFALNQFNPFIKEKNQKGDWYDSFRMGLDLRGGYQVTNDITSRRRSTTYTEYKVIGVENRPLTNEELRRQNLGLSNNQTVIELNSIENIKSMFRDLGQFKTSYSVPITLPNFKLAKYINITPSFNVGGDTYAKKLDYTFIADSNAVRVDTLKRGMNGYQPVYLSPRWSTGASMNTRIYGTYQFKKGKRIQAIRHTLSPSIGFNYNPDNTNQFKQVRVRNDDPTLRYLPLYEGLGGVSRAGSSMSFNLSNQLEAKIRSRSDTAESNYEKINLLDNLNLGFNYNFVPVTQNYKISETETLENKGFNLSDISLGTNTSILKGLINVNMNMVLEPYAYVSDTAIGNLAGRKVPIFKWKQAGEDGKYISNAGISIGTSISPKTFSRDAKDDKKKKSTDPGKEAMQKFVQANPMAYVDFSIPWSMSINYNLNYNKQGLAPSQVTQALQFQGDLSLTPKWKITFSSGWDFVFDDVTLTSFGIMRELHCWDISFDWTPIAGNNQRASNYSFTLRPRSSLLSDLKLSRRRLYYDRGGF